MRRPVRYLLVFLALFGFVAASCGDDSSSSSSSTAVTTAVAPATTATATTTNPAVTGNITVFAAASLTESFKALGAAFEASHAGTKVTFNFAASSALVAQINQGAPADVFASADTANMDKLTGTGGAGAAGTPVAFATNKLEIIVQKGNPKNITTVNDLANPAIAVVTCAPEVPIGKYTQQVFTNAGITVTPKSLEPDVKGVVNKVVLGEADAGVVYATDVQAAGDKAQGVAIPDNINVIATYPIAQTKDAKNPPTSAAFMSFVTSSAGQAILAKFGFSAP